LPLAGEFHETFHVAKNEAGLGGDLLAYGGNRHLPPGPVYQLRAELGFELLYGGAECGLGNE
jgi:hypothetical protein